MATDASSGRTFYTGPGLSGFWVTAPNLLLDLERTNPPEPLDKTDPVFRALTDNPMVGVAITSPDKRWIKVNDKYCEMMGYSREELASLDWAELTHPDDLASNAALFNRFLSGEIRDYMMEKRYLRKNREVLFAEISVSGLRGPDGALKCAVTLVVDVSQRKLAERSLADMTRKLIEAQERERTRIGRDLHDDIGQRLALLAMDMDLLRKDPSMMPVGLRKLRADVNEISRDLQSLSHDLHADRLEYLGAVAGIRSWCVDFGARYKIRVDFTSNVRAPLPGVVGICLFRVVQEALQNVVKHSGTDWAKVNFAESPKGVRLVISDAGRGFDPREVRGGLGLISMRERIRLLDGTVVIKSGPMRGTSILVRVPLHRNDQLNVAGPVDT